MQQKVFYYLLRIQYLGFRYSGWQKQPNQKTIEQMILKTLKFVLPNAKLKILGAGRTDAKVSALNAAFELFLHEPPLNNLQLFLDLFNENLPPDIRALSIEKTKKEFNIIQDSKVKEYVYLFSFGNKNHPFCAPFLTNIIDDLNVDAMKKAAKLFEGTHDFSAYTARKKMQTKSIRKVTRCEIIPNSIVKANFFPKTSYALHIASEGFMRYQVRMIMGALIEVGKGALSIDEIKNSLKENSAIKLTSVAPGSGLVLNSLEFDN